MGDLTPILELSLEKVLGYLPKRLRRWLYPTAKIEKEIKINIRSNNPIQIGGGDVPNMTLWLVIKNYSLVDLELDRMLIGILVNSQTILQGSMIKRHKIPKRNETGINFHEILTPIHIEYLKKRCNPQTKQIETIHVDVEADFKLNSEIIKINANNIYAQNVKCEF